MPFYIVPVWVIDKGEVIVEASSPAEAIEKVKGGDYGDAIDSENHAITLRKGKVREDKPLNP